MYGCGESLDALDYKHHDGGHGYQYGVHGWGAFLLWFIIIAVIVFIILYLLKPTFVQNFTSGGVPTGEVNAGKALVSAIIIALIIVLILWLLKSVARC